MAAINWEFANQLGSIAWFARRKRRITIWFHICEDLETVLRHQYPGRLPYEP